ncbi:UbiX family flavin prenyltransferase [Candidatus Hepatincolaceae symbiont of Richtersius coronifer]
MSNSLPIIIGITGATGAIYAIALLKALKQLDYRTILIVSEMGFYTIKDELNMTPKQVIALADEYYSNSNLGAPIASGSFLTLGMIVAPCSVKSLSGIAHAYDDTLITRAADVVLKERRRLVLLLRETPFNLIHINLMKQATESGAIIMPPVPAFYNKPNSIADIVSHTVARCLDLFAIENDLTLRWNPKKV